MSEQKGDVPRTQAALDGLLPCSYLEEKLAKCAADLERELIACQAEIERINSAKTGGLVQWPSEEVKMQFEKWWVDIGQAYDGADEFWMAGFNAAQARALPDGWVAVPREPTTEMLDAGEEGVMNGAQEGMGGGCGKCHRDAYYAMINAAPTKPVVDE